MVSSARGVTRQVELLARQRHDLVHGLDFGGERLGLNFLLDESSSQQVGLVHGGVDGPQDSPLYHHVPMKHDRTACQHDLVQATPPSTGTEGGAVGLRSHDHQQVALPLSLPEITSPTSLQDSEGGGGGASSRREQLQRHAYYSTPVHNCEATCAPTACCWTFCTNGGSARPRACRRAR